MSLAILKSRALAGMDAPEVTVEVHLANGLPSFTIVGAGGNGSQGSQGPSQGRHPECPIRVPGQKDHGQSGSG